MKIQCEKCGRQYEVEESYIGRDVECECGHKWQLPKNEAKHPQTEKAKTTVNDTKVFVGHAGAGKMKIQCEKCGRQYEVEESYTGRYVECECGHKWQLPKNEAKHPQFVRPGIAICIDMIGLVIIILGIIDFVLGIAICIDEGKNLLLPVLCIFVSIFVIISGVFIGGFGAALNYLAEIAYNTRKNKN